MRVQSLFSFLSRATDRTAVKPNEQKQIGPLKVSPMGLGTWAWGNQLLWGYDKSMDQELQQLFNLVVSKGINIFDTADSYGKHLRPSLTLQAGNFGSAGLFLLIPVQSATV